LFYFSFISHVRAALAPMPRINEKSCLRVRARTVVAKLLDSE